MNDQNNSPRYVCEQEHLEEVLDNLLSISRLIVGTRMDVSPEQLIIKDIYDQLIKFKTK